VLEVVGQRGMGIVLQAFDEKLHRVVALKAHDAALASNGSARHRFVREARAATAVSHDNVIAIHAVEDEGPVPYLVMQFIHGKTLAAEPAPLPRRLAPEPPGVGVPGRLPPADHTAPNSVTVRFFVG
jgi:serine/threonine protein kinase